MLESEYEKDKWKVPLKKGFKWMNFGPVKKWTDDEWPRALKFYNTKGFNRQGTLNYMRKYKSPNVTINDVDEKDDEF